MITGLTHAGTGGTGDRVGQDIGEAGGIESEFRDMTENADKRLEESDDLCRVNVGGDGAVLGGSCWS